jgi:hypothetical protein
MKVGSETGIQKSINLAVDGTQNAVRLLSASLAERSVCNGRATVRSSLTDAASSNRRAHEPHAH